MRLILIISIFVCSTTLFAKDHPFDFAFIQKVQELFFDQQGISQKKTIQYQQRLIQKRKEIVGLDENDEMLKNSVLISKYRQEGDKEKKIRKKIKEHEYNYALERALYLISYIATNPSLSEVYISAQEVLDLEAAIRIDGERTPLESAKELSKAALIQWKILKNPGAAKEATNLIYTGAQNYLSEKDIQSLVNQNKDLSLLQPGPSSFWQQPSLISERNLHKAAQGSYSSLYNHIKYENQFPETPVVRYEGMRYSDTKPKMDVSFKDREGKKRKIKLKLGGELHSDPTASALMMVLGFPTDLTQYRRDIKVLLGDRTVDDLKREWELYYDRQDFMGRFRFEDLSLESGVTAEGENYVIFPEGLFEARPEKVERLGPWAFGDNSNDSRREVRGLTLLQIWLDNHDIKEMDNNHLLLKETESDLRERYHIISDPGASLSLFMYEMPDLYFWNVVTGVTDKHINLAFFSIPVKIKNKITYADARWMMRYISALSREQISEAVTLGHWPQCVQEIYVEKLISRRNNLVEKLDLIGQTDFDGNRIQLLPASDNRDQYRYKARCQKQEIETHFTTNFEFGFDFLMGRLSQSAKGALLDGARAAMNSMNKVVIRSDHFDLDFGPIAEVIFDPQREIQANPNPKSLDEMYIVKDSLKVGFRYGLIYGAYLDQSIYINLSLSYPARSLEEARLSQDFVVNLMLFKDVKNNKLPPKYVLMSEHSVSYGSGVALNGGTVLPSPLELRLGKGEIRLHRSILDYRNDQATFYRERQLVDTALLEANIRLGIIKMPLFESLAYWGQANGKGFSIAKDNLDTSEILSAMLSGDYSSVTDQEKEFYLSNHFSQKQKNWKFLFAGYESEKRLENITLTQDEGTQDVLQYRTYSQRNWSFLGDGEQKSKTITMFTNPRSLTEDYQIDISVIAIDKKTKDQELEETYISFINNLSFDHKPIIPLTPSLGYTRNGHWGHLVISSESEIYPEGVKELLNMDEATFWSELAKVLKKDFLELKTLKENYFELQKAKKQTRGAQSARLYRMYSLTRDDERLIKNSLRFLSDFNELRSKNQLIEKVKALSEALRGALFMNTKGFYDSRILSALFKVAGPEHVYSRNIVGVPDFSEVNLLGGSPLVGEVGQQAAHQLEYLVYTPLSALELYKIFDSWF